MTIFIDDDELGEDDEGLIVEPDASPEADPDTAYCPYCDYTFIGFTRNLLLGRHKQTAHPEEFAAERAARGQPLTTPKKPGPKPGAKKVAGVRKVAQDRSPQGTETSELKEVHDNVLLYYSISAMALSMRDPVCAAAIRDAAKPAADAWVQLARENEKIRHFWAGGTGSITWLQLAMAHMPIAQSVAAHHITPIFERRRELADAMMGGDEGAGDQSGDGETVVYNTGSAEETAPLTIVPDEYQTEQDLAIVGAGPLGGP